MRALAAVMLALCGLRVCGASLRSQAAVGGCGSGERGKKSCGDYSDCGACVCDSSCGWCVTGGDCTRFCTVLGDLSDCTWTECPTAADMKCVQLEDWEGSAYTQDGGVQLNKDANKKAKRGMEDEIKQRAYTAYASPVGQTPKDKPPATGIPQHSEMMFPQWDTSGSGSGSGSA